MFFTKCFREPKTRFLKGGNRPLSGNIRKKHLILRQSNFNLSYFCFFKFFFGYGKIRQNSILNIP